MTAFTWKRTLRTSSSERFLALRDNVEVAAIDLHYLPPPNSTVSGTVILLENTGIRESDIPELLRSLDEDFLPDVDLTRGTLTYTVVIGRLIGNYEAQYAVTPTSDVGEGERSVTR